MFLAQFNHSNMRSRFRSRAAASAGRRAAFTLTELLVVIGIIVLLVGILLAALSKARDTALKTQTQTSMSGFAQAAQTYQIEHGRYPGLVPDRVLAASDVMTAMESAILALMGGARVLSPQDDVQVNGLDTPAKVAFDEFNGTQISFGATDWKVKVDENRIGEGPYIDGKSYSPYFTPKESELGSIQGLQANEVETSGQVSIAGMAANFRLPDLIDGWGQPVVLVRRSRSIGPIVGDTDDNPQFLYDSAAGTLVGTAAYVQATDLGEQHVNQTSSGGSEQYSILEVGSAAERRETWSQILSHPSLAGEARGAFMLLSAGPDGVYFSRIDGPGSPREAIGDVLTITDFHDMGASIIDEFDDVRVFGGN
jgi:type II secretory pathway pseudopilin PulG